MMYGVHTGISIAEEINFCPFCGEQIGEWRGDGTAVCPECHKVCAVIEVEED